MNFTREGVTRIEADKLLRHEDINYQNFERSLQEILKSKKVSPIIVDSKTLLVIDGHHRLAALRSLGYRRIPVMLVDYDSPTVKVYGWRRYFSPELLAKTIIKNFQSEGKFCAEYEKIRICEDNLYSLYWKLDSLENYLSSIGFCVQKNQEHGLKPPILTKEYVLEIAKKGLLFPPKSTRHTYDFIIPKYLISVECL
ncbi:ParB N-terminal domain-containing protein [Sulfuracidifex metallicus]|uniref:ParB N-terminal domain-containing protein n=1 Tax=Sulfuracidifex metallicus TaxID=47303 RepID=UPI0006D12171|nr:ParB N-terminal domain-containing protein [Sulfuracidifex metallicus]WOE50728.1 ParB N-terminal domain-containing protein [Sulfuracidifex metallicus DSM 6482 = JCM 9184]